ncbi:MAG: LytR C-terminal domain-containing protein, partial [Armatimonadetes bacterium]|nr:LytR C-terminal domain-containing protein [Armatimonadota bacterium]
DIAGTGNAAHPNAEKTFIEYPPGTEDDAEQLARDLGVEDAELREVDTGLDRIRITLGPDFAQRKRAGDADH